MTGQMGNNVVQSSLTFVREIDVHKLPMTYFSMYATHDSSYELPSVYADITTITSVNIKILDDCPPETKTGCAWDSISIGLPLFLG